LARPHRQGPMGPSGFSRRCRREELNQLGRWRRTKLQWESPRHKRNLDAFQLIQVSGVPHLLASGFPSVFPAVLQLEFF
jgi:hypothetical protein